MGRRDEKGIVAVPTRPPILRSHGGVKCTPSAPPPHPEFLKNVPLTDELFSRIFSPDQGGAKRLLLRA